MNAYRVVTRNGETLLMRETRPLTHEQAWRYFERLGRVLALAHYDVRRVGCAFTAERDGKFAMSAAIEEVAP